MTSEDFLHPAAADFRQSFVEPTKGLDRPARPAGHEDTGGPVQAAPWRTMNRPPRCPIPGLNHHHSFPYQMGYGVEPH